MPKTEAQLRAQENYNRRKAERGSLRLPNTWIPDDAEAELQRIMAATGCSKSEAVWTCIRAHTKIKNPRLLTIE